MDPISNRSSPVLTEPSTINKSRSLCLHSNVPPRSAPAAYSPGLYLTIPRKKAVILDDVRSSGWLDSMKSSSPPPKKSKDTDGDIMEDDLDDAYRTWMLKYPSALTSFDQITAFAKGKRIALFLDYDGTLSPIVDNPDLAFMSESMRAVVRKVAKCFPTAIISGRSRDKVFEFVKLNELYYAGSHGMDIMGPRRYHFSSDSRGCMQSTEKQGKGLYLFQPASEFLLMIDEVSVLFALQSNTLVLVEHDPQSREFTRAHALLPRCIQVYKSLVGLTKNIRGVRVEHNMFCTSVHYRNVDEKNWTVVAKCVQDALKYYPRLYMTHGRKVLEIRPKINWDKGKAVMFLLESLGLSNRKDVIAIYVGDDRTDEDAFEVLKEESRGYGILVSSTPKDSSASYSLRDTLEVMEFLKSLVVWKKSPGAL